MRNLINSLKLAGVMALFGLASCKYNTNNYYYPDCDTCAGKDKAEEPKYQFGDNNVFNWEHIDNSGGGTVNNQTAINAGCGDQSGNQNIGSSGGAKKVVKKDDNGKKEEDKKQELPEDDKKPCDCEPECKTVTKTTYEHFCISGDPNDVVNAAIRIVNSNHR